MFDKRRLGRTTRRWRIVNIAVPIRRRQGAFAPHVVSCWTNDSVPAGSMHTDPKVRNCDTGRSPTPSTWQGDRAAAGEGLIALFCPSQARAFSTKALKLSQRAAAVLWSWSASRPEGWGPGSSRCCRQLISQDPGAREQDVATTSGRRSSFEGRCVDPASPTQPTGEGFEAARGPPPDSVYSRILSTVFFKQEFLEGGLHAGRDSAGIPRSEGVRQLSQV